MFFVIFTARKYESGEYLNITNITRDQAGDYECGAENDISSPDTKTVKVTVNCEYHTHLFCLFTVGCHGIACHMFNKSVCFSSLEIQALFQNVQCCLVLNM